MDDRELLELAAKAVGIPAEWRSNPDEAGFLRLAHIIDGIFQCWWMPLDDDGDSFRLAIDLDICLRLQGDELTGIAHWHRNGRTNRVVGTYHTGNRSEARLLVLRAAAEIGKLMP